MRRAKATAQAMLEEATQLRNPDDQRKAVQWALRQKSAHQLKAMVTLAESESGVAVLDDQFDVDPYLFNVKNGTIDLRTGELHPHRRSDLITKLAPVDYDPSACSPRFAAFLNRIFDKNGDLIEFMQRSLGYSLSGSDKEQVVFVLYGTGQNGKSTLLDLITELTGDYAETVEPDGLNAKSRSQHPTGLASLHGSRFVTAIETDEGRRLAEGLVKALTGGDRIKVRRLYEEWFKYKPTFKLFLAVNHKPIIRGTDYAIWRRIRLVPFDVTIPEDDRDRDLPDKLRDELPGVMAWAVRGCLAWQRNGLGEPPAVKDATAHYREEMDLVRTFLESECIRSRGCSIKKQDLYKVYKRYCEQIGDQPLSQPKLSACLKEKEIGEGRGTGGKHLWTGLGLRSDLTEATQ
jgi:putative DNA primase/helicase